MKILEARPQAVAHYKPDEDTFLIMVTIPGQGPAVAEMSPHSMARILRVRENLKGRIDLTKENI